MKKLSIVILALVLSYGFTSCTNRTENKDSVEHAEDMNEMKDSANSPMAVDDADTKFAVEAADEGLMEVEMGNLAQQKATHQRVKDFAAMMVRDHSKANDQLKTLAASKNITVPATMGEEKMKMVNDMREKSGTEFDREYIDHMVEHHKDDIDKFEKMANDGKDGDLKSFASLQLPTLRAHLDSARAVQTMLKDRNSARK